jgi:signal transduction histidine kinase
VTVAKQVAATLAQAKEAAERASTAKTAFLAHMSHELRTPLNAIIGFSDLIRTRIVGPEIHDTYVEYAQDIHDSGRHLLSLINDVLDVARIETGAAKLDETLVSTRATAYAAVRFIQVLAEEKGVRLVIDDGKLEERALRCDARGLRQCLINLLSNAVKFTDAGGQIEVSGRVLTDGGYALAVRDTGSGIPADRLPSLFQPFANADPSLARGSLGAGLGLSITQGIVRMHGGRLDVRSQVGEGTTVTVILPAGRVLEPVDLAESRIARFASK